MLSHFADSRSSGLRAAGRRRTERTANIIFLLTIAALSFKAIFSLIAYLQGI
jgi:hypothetical protein